MSFLLADITTQFCLRQSCTPKETTCLSPLRSIDGFFFFLFYIYLCGEYVCQKWRTAVSLVSFPVWKCIREQSNVKLSSTGASSAIKKVVADRIPNPWPGLPSSRPHSMSALSVLRGAGLAHHSHRNTSSVSTDISKYQCRADDALLRTNNVRLKAEPWHLRWSMAV